MPGRLQFEHHSTLFGNFLRTPNSHAVRSLSRRFILFQGRCCRPSIAPSAEIAPFAKIGRSRRESMAMAAFGQPSPLRAACEAAINRRRSSKNPGYVFTVHWGSRMTTPGLRKPTSAMLIAMRWSL